MDDEQSDDGLGARASGGAHEPGGPGPTAEAQMMYLAGSIGGTKGRRLRLVRVLVAVVLLAGLALGLMTLVQALGS